MAFDAWLKSVEVRSDGPTRLASVRFKPIALEPARFAPLRLAGAWQVEVDDARFGGISAVALDDRALLALSDSGTVTRLPKPGMEKEAPVEDLPAGPGSPQFKINRDSEALTRDPAGRGWWVAFEHWHQLWLYDRGFRRPLARLDLGKRRWPANLGIEAMAASPGRLVIFPESGEEWLQISRADQQRRSLENRFGSIADAVRLADGRLLLVTRQFTLRGIIKRLVALDEKSGSLRHFAAIGLAPTDNVEAIAAEPLIAGRTRLWLMTDNDFRPRKATLLIAVDLP